MTQITQEILTEQKEKYGRSILHTAASYGNIKLVMEILKSSNDKGTLKEVLTAKNNFGDTPLHEAAIKVYSDLNWDGWTTNTEIVKLILQAAKENGSLKEIINIKNSDGYTALEEAQFWGYTKIKKEILKFKRYI